MLAPLVLATCGTPDEEAPTRRLGRGATDPPDGWIVFTSNRSGNGDVYGIARPGDRPVLLVGGPEAEGTARFDPARNRLIHHRYRNDIIEVVAGSDVLITDSTGLVEPQWSNSGDVVYALESEEGGHLVIADSTGRSTRRIVEDEAIERYPAWSPSGESVAYAKRMASGWDLHVFDLRGGNERRLTFDEVYVGHPAWSPDGSRLAFDRMVDDQTEIFTLDLETSVVKRLTERPGMELAPAWSRDGGFLAFASGEGPNWDIWLVDMGTAGITRLTEHSATDGGPIFLPGSALPARQ